MTIAIEGIVDAYVKLGDRRALEDLRMHRRRLAIDLNGRSGPYDFSRPLGQINEEIAAIEAGLERLTPTNEMPGKQPGLIASMPGGCGDNRELI